MKVIVTQIKHCHQCPYHRHWTNKSYNSTGVVHECSGRECSRVDDREIELKSGQDFPDYCPLDDILDVSEVW